MPTAGEAAAAGCVQSCATDRPCRSRWSVTAPLTGGGSGEASLRRCVAAATAATRSSPPCVDRSPLGARRRAGALPTAAASPRGQLRRLGCDLRSGAPTAARSQLRRCRQPLQAKQLLQPADLRQPAARNGRDFPARSKGRLGRGQTDRSQPLRQPPAWTSSARPGRFDTERPRANTGSCSSTRVSASSPASACGRCRTAVKDSGMPTRRALRERAAAGVERCRLGRRERSPCSTRCSEL